MGAAMSNVFSGASGKVKGCCPNLRHGVLSWQWKVS